MDKRAEVSGFLKSRRDRITPGQAGLPVYGNRLDALSRPTLGFPADVMREASVVAGVYGAQLPDIDDPRAQAVRRTTAGTQPARGGGAIEPGLRSGR